MFRSSKSRFALFIAATGLIASGASADFQFSNTRRTFDADGKSYDAITFYAFNDSKGYTLNGSKLLAMDISVASSTVMRFETGHANDSFSPPPPGSSTPTYYEADTGLDIVLGDTAGQISSPSLGYTKLVLPIFGDPALVLFNNNPNPETTSRNGNNPIANYTNRKSFAVLGFGLGVAEGIPANVGLGAAFATVVAESGAIVTVSGKIAGDTGTAGATLIDGPPLDFLNTPGPSVPYAYTALAPEPATLAACLAATTILRRRCV